MEKLILAVDDEPINLDLMEAILLPEGFRLETAENGMSTLEKLKQITPDLILLDIMMPDMDGFEVCSRIRSNKGLPYIPIIFVTAKYKDPEDIVYGLDIGGDDYIAKPFNPPELLSRIRSALRLKGLYDRLAQIKNELSRYVSLSTMEMIEKTGSTDPTRTGETREVTVLFSDIRGFTAFSEKMDPRMVFEMLNLYLSKQIAIIEAYHGIIDKLSGDEIMAIFEGPQMVDNALHCGRTIINSLQRLDKSEDDEWVGVGIGINTGPVYVGSIGSETIKDFTVVGNTVNMAARLCGCAHKFEVVFSEHTKKLVDDRRFTYKSAGKISLKGIRESIEVFKLQ